MSTIVKAENRTNVKGQEALDVLRQRHSEVKGAEDTLRQVQVAAGIARVLVARAAFVALRESGLSQSALSRETGIPRATLVGYIHDAERGLWGGKWTKGKNGKDTFVMGEEPIHDPYATTEPTEDEVNGVAKERERRGRADKRAKREKARLAKQAKEAEERGEVSESQEVSSARQAEAKRLDADAMTYGSAKALMLQAAAQLQMLEKSGPASEEEAEVRAEVQALAAKIAEVLA